MDIDRDAVIEIVVSAGVVGLFAVLLVWIGLQYNDGGLSEQGGLVLVGAIALFVIVMSGMGLGLAYYMNRK